MPQPISQHFSKGDIFNLKASGVPLQSFTGREQSCCRVFVDKLSSSVQNLGDCSNLLATKVMSRRFYGYLFVTNFNLQLPSGNHCQPGWAYRFIHRLGEWGLINLPWGSGGRAGCLPIVMAVDLTVTQSRC